MIKITLPDGSIKEFEASITPFDVAKSISDGLARSIISASFNGTTIETTTELTTDGSLILYTFNDDNGKKAFWHSSAHVLGETLEQEFGVQLCHGPPTDAGFFYDSYSGKDVSFLIRSN